MDGFSFRVVDYFPPETPESLYHYDRIRMATEARRRSLDPETLAVMDHLNIEVDRQLIGLHRKEAA